MGDSTVAPGHGGKGAKGTKNHCSHGIVNSPVLWPHGHVRRPRKGKKAVRKRMEIVK